MEVPVTLFSIITLVLTYVPGLVFKRFYFTGEFTKQFGAGIFIERFITCIFTGILIQLVTFLLARNVLDIDTNSTIVLVKSFYRQLTSNDIPGTFEDYKSITLYLLISLLIAGFLGIVAHKLVRLLKPDKKSIFRASIKNSFLHEMVDEFVYGRSTVFL
ncbi:hypothetical protein [Niabella hirudinis]|uniref:hypothetical protein n=1 Tax=Niabella hirudinis TaxID=1285929 RepID=UPI003EBFAB27